MRRRTVRLGTAQLKAAARVLERCGLHVEFDGEPPPPRSGRHTGLVREMRIALLPFLPLDRVVVEAASVEMPGREPGGYRTPDLAVCPSGFLRSDERFLHPQAVDTAVEVVTGPATEEEITGAVTWYGRAGVPSLLVLDPRAGGSWTLHTDPATGTYRHTHHGPFGEDLPLPHLGLRVPTEQLAAYRT